MGVVVANALVEPSGPRWPEALVTLTMAVVYAVGTTRWVQTSRPRSRWWLLALICLWVLLLCWVPEAVFLAFPLYFLTAHLLPDRWAIAAVGALTVVAVTGFSLHRGWSLGAAIGPALGAVVAVGTVLGLRAVERDSARKGVLEERERLAREIHDTLAQGFASINLLLGAASTRLRSEEQANVESLRLVDQARDVAVANMAEARRFVLELAPTPLQHSALVETLARTVREFPRATFSSEGVEAALPAPVEVALLRIAREALTNAGRYSGAERVGVTLTWHDDAVGLDVVDNGGGFDNSSPVAGFGLTSMRTRAEELAGTFVVESAPGAGTAIAVLLPLDREPAR